MTQAKHTPGPWHVEPNESTLGADMAICSADNDWIVAVIPHDPDIQTTNDPDGDSVVWHDADHANACLIAAAPEMLAALDDALFALECAINLKGLRSLIPSAEKARAAIAKAKGHSI